MQTKGQLVRNPEYHEDFILGNADGGVEEGRLAKRKSAGSMVSNMIKFGFKNHSDMLGPNGSHL
jgi:hypothetical protein